MLNTCLDKLHDFCYFMITRTQPFFLYQPIYYLIWIKVTIYQTNLIVTLNFKLCQSGFSVLPGRLIRKSKICLLCPYVDQMIIQQKLKFFSSSIFTIFSLMFFPLLWTVFTDMLKIYELPKVYNKKYLNIATKTCFTWQ